MYASRNSRWNFGMIRAQQDYTNQDPVQILWNILDMVPSCPMAYKTYVVYDYEKALGDNITTIIFVNKEWCRVFIKPIAVRIYWHKEKNNGNISFYTLDKTSKKHIAVSMKILFDIQTWMTVP